MNKYTIFFSLIIIIITFYEFRTSLFEGFERNSNSVQNCSEMSDCKTCVQTKTGQDGICYWCNGKCTASDNYYPGCSSDPAKCGKGPNPVNPIDPVYPTDNCPKCEVCPKLTLLRTPTFMTTQ
jgi:hypothetical protein